MQRRFNYTGRINIEDKRIDIEYNPDNEDYIFIKSIDISGYDIKEDAYVFAEVIYRNEYLRQFLGSVSSLKLPNIISIKELSYKESLSIRIIIVDQEKYKLLGSTDLIKIRKKKIASSGLLPVKFESIGKLVWKLDFSYDEVDKPLLLVNEQIPGIEKVITSDPIFIMNVYPSVLKELLIRIIFIERVDPNSTLGPDWRGQWLSYAIMLNKREKMPDKFITDEDCDENLINEWYEWIEEVVRRFCEKREEWNQLINREKIN